MKESEWERDKITTSKSKYKHHPKLQEKTIYKSQEGKFHFAVISNKMLIFVNGNEIFVT